MNPRILLVASTTGYQTRSFAEAAQRQGVEVTLATDRCHVLEDPWRDRAVPIRFEEPDESAAALASLQLDGIVAVADHPTLIAALAAQILKIPWHPPEAVRACRNKHRMRTLFEAANLLVPRNFCVPVHSDPLGAVQRTSFPCVLKPLGLSASRGVIRANKPAEFVTAFERIRRLLQQPEIQYLHEEWNQAIQIEEYIEGREFALEGIMTAGELTVLAIFDKPDPLEGPFFEETIYVTPSRASAAIQSAIVDVTKRAVAALQLRHGPIHAEMRVNGSGVWMLEVAARPIGGLCARALRFETDLTSSLTLEDVIVLHAVGTMPASLTLSPPASGVMMIPIPRAGVFHSASGIIDARNVPCIADVVITVKPGQQLIPLPEGASYAGFIFAGGDHPAEVEAALRLAHGRLEFEILASLDVVAS